MTEEFYPDFVARSGQVNTPPGSYETIKEWIREGFITNQSNVLEIGCTTGFIVNQINRYTGAKVTGIDLSASAINKAILSSRNNTEITFQEANAKKLPFADNQFSHVIIGGHLPWVSEQEREEHVKEAIRVLKPNGFLLTCLYYFHTKPPEQFIKEFNETFNTQLSSNDNYESWSSLFKTPNLFLEHESNYKIICPDSTRKTSYIERFEQQFQKEWEQKVELFSENGKYLGFFVKVFQKIDCLDTYVQIPRGGIYQWEKK